MFLFVSNQNISKNEKPTVLTDSNTKLELNANFPLITEKWHLFLMQSVYTFIPHLWFCYNLSQHHYADNLISPLHRMKRGIVQNYNKGHGFYQHFILFYLYINGRKATLDIIRLIRPYVKSFIHYDKYYFLGWKYYCIENLFALKPFILWIIIIALKRKPY